MQIQQFLKTFEILRQHLHREIPAQQVVLFLTVAQHPEGITQYDLAETLGMHQGSVSRNIQKLSLVKRPGRDGQLETVGYDVIRQAPDMVETRRLACFLTARGRRIVRELELSDRP